MQLGDDAYERLVEPTVSEYVGAAFERVCRRAPRPGPKTYDGIGYWWHKHHELDALGLATDGTLVAGECKYTTSEMTAGDLAHLERSARAVELTPPGGDSTYHYRCSCRSGFGDGLRRIAEDRADVSLFAPSDIVSAEE